ncbi:hypothetical protein [Nitratifractor sp.]
MEKSPEALRIYFSGPAALKFLESNDLTVHEVKVIEAAMATARTANPDLDLLREADAIVHRVSHPAAEEPRERREPERAFAESPLASLSRPMPRPGEEEPNPRTFLGYLQWRARWEQRQMILVPLITFGLIFLAFLILKYVPGAQERLFTANSLPFSSAHYEEAVERCSKLDKRLPETVEELQESLDGIPDYKAKTGYWIGDGRVYYPATGEVKAKDRLLHWVVCVE